MSTLTFLNSSELAAIGLSAADRAAFVEARIRFGALGSAQAIDRVTKALSPNGAKAFSAYVKAQGPVATLAPSPLNSLHLVLVPTPPMYAQPGMRLVVGFRRQTESADFEETLPFTLGGVSDMEYHDVNLDHLIFLRVLTTSGDVVAERVLRPLREQHGELVAATWSAIPPMGPNETLRAKSGALEARLAINTLRPAAVPAKPAAALPRFERNGRFVVIGQPDFGFGGYALSVALATPALLTAVEATLVTAKGTLAAQVRFSAGDARFATLAATLPLVAGELDYGGSFRTRQEARALDKVAGWVWVLTGPDTVVGFRPDPAPSEPAPEALIFLPDNLAAQPNQGGLPQDVSEATLLARPDLFSDDPGSRCKPFSNPGRILGEKRFRTALRVTQPQVAMAVLTPIRFEGQDKRTVDFPRLDVDPGNPVDYEAHPSRFQAQSVALGHIIEHVVRYRSNGYSLGNIAHSLTLAPREKRRIMKVDFTRQERAKRTEGTSTGDEVSDTLDSQHDYDGAVSGELGEWSRGSSESSAVGAAGGIGGVLPIPVVIGGGISGGASQSSATQASHRETAARESQRLRDAIRRYGQSLRNLESTVVTEVSQSETVTGVSEVVQNINYTRALTIVYYEILRHLRVDTEVGAVSEYVFVPMPIRPFSDLRISRHRKVLSRFARGWLEKSVFRYLDDIQANFVGSEVPEGEQRDQPLTRLSGSLTMTMGINMPVGGAPSGPATTNGDSDTQLHQTAVAFEDAWQPFAHLLPMPVPVLAQMLARTRSSPADTEKLFRTQIAPAMARAFVEHLTIRGIRLDAPIDFTPVSGYKRGQTFQVDFDVAVDGTITRRHLESLTLRIDQNFSLPPGSWLNLTGANISYASSHYEGRASQRSGKRDLLDTITGAPDSGGAHLTFPPSSDDLLDLRKRLKQGYAELQKTLEANTFRYHKAIWRGIDADELYALLDGYAISEADGRSLASVIERRPIGVLGNSLVFATRTDWPLDPLYKSFAELKAHYVSGLPPADPMRVSLPTSGLYARAHMDECIAAEEHNGSFDWVFSSTEPELADFPTGLFDSRRSEPQGLTPTALPDTIINLQNAPAAPAPNGLANTFAALGSDAFRDITGLAGTQETLRAAMSNATNLASTAMSQAIAGHAAQLTSDARAGKDLTTFAAATQKAVDRGQMSQEAGQKAVEDMAARKGNGGQSGSADDLHQQVLTGDAEASHSSVDKDGTTKTTSKKPTPQREPDPVAAVSVIPIPESNQILFLNFATDSPALLDDHIRYLERLAGEVGISIDDVVNIEGHASTAGAAAHNEDLGRDRAFALFNRLHALVTPLGASPDYSPAFLSTAGETGSYRARFAHVPAVANTKGKGHPNDPVEKAVLFTLKAGVNLDPKARRYDCGGTEVTVINNYIFVGGKAFCSLPNGRVKEIDRSSVSVLNNNVLNTEVRTGDNTIAINVGPVTISPNISFAPNISLNLRNGLSLLFGRDPATGVIAEPVKTPPLAEQLRDAWQIKLFEPTIVNPRSMAQVVEDVGNFAFDIAKSGLSLPAGAPQILKDIVAKAATVLGDATVAAPDKPGALFDFLLAKLGLAQVKTLLGMMRFGAITMRGQIKVKGENAMVDGLFSSSGLVIGTTGATSAAVILNNADYKTKQALKLVDWENQRNFKEFSYIDNGTVGAALAGSLAAAHLLKALEDLVTSVMPGIVQMLADAAASALLRLLSEFHTTVAQYAPNAALMFRAFDGDDFNQIDVSSVIPTGAQLRMITMTPNAIAFTKTNQVGP